MAGGIAFPRGSRNTVGVLWYRTCSDTVEQLESLRVTLSVYVADVHT